MALTINNENGTTAGSFPVKNGFIHFSSRGGDGAKGSRALRRWSTDTDAVNPTDAFPPHSKDLKENISPNLVVPEVEKKFGHDTYKDPYMGFAPLPDFSTSTPEPSPRRHRGFVTPDYLVSVGSSPVPASPGSSSPETRVMLDVGQHLAPIGHQTLRRVSLAAELNLPGAIEQSKNAPAKSSRASPLNSSTLVGTYQFNFTLRLQNKGTLGLEYLSMSTPSSQALIVEQVLPDGAVEAWNKQCADGSTRRHDAVHRGDAIVAVNSKTDCSSMAEECRSKMLLKLTVLRTISGGAAGLLAPPQLTPPQLPQCLGWSDSAGCSTCTFWAVCARCRSLGKHVGTQADHGHQFWTDFGDMTH